MNQDIVSYIKKIFRSSTIITLNYNSNISVDLVAVAMKFWSLVRVVAKIWLSSLSNFFLIYYLIRNE